MSERVSIKDIARAAQMSHSTVSRALRGSSLISPATRRRIEGLAREMGYTPNAVAQSLQNRRTNTIGLVVTSIADPFFADVVKGVEEFARPAGYSVFLNSSHNDPDQELHVIETFHRRRVDGILVASSRIGSHHAGRLADINLPVVLVNSQAEGHSDRLYSVSVDDVAGARLAVEHLLGCGHRRIGYLGASNRPRSSERRYQGYAEALRQAGITPRNEWMAIAAPAEAEREGDVETGRRLTHRLLESGVTAVFCMNDMLAVGSLTACRTLGRSVPGQCSIVGFDDIMLARYMCPPLTTVHQPKQDMGHVAMQMLQQLIEGRPVQDLVLAPALVIRESSSAPDEGL